MSFRQVEKNQREHFAKTDQLFANKSLFCVQKKKAKLIRNLNVNKKQLGKK